MLISPSHMHIGFPFSPLIFLLFLFFSFTGISWPGMEDHPFPETEPAAHPSLTIVDTE